MNSLADQAVLQLHEQAAEARKLEAAQARSQADAEYDDYDVRTLMHALMAANERDVCQLLASMLITLRDDKSQKCPVLQFDAMQARRLIVDMRADDIRTDAFTWWLA